MRFAWSDDWLLGDPGMDATHREFVACVDALLEAPDALLAQRLADFEAHARGHFGEEDEAIRTSAHEAGGCHVDEHAAVLASLAEVRAALEQGRAEVVRAFARALADWFPEHARVMDLGLARHLSTRRLGGAPVRLVRARVAEPQSP